MGAAWEWRLLTLHREPELDHVVGRIHQVLLGAEVPFGRLNRGMPEQQLDVLKLPTGGAA